mmetsp:Transcript_11057/g.28347  ORF Transcript_11057/g.28347 Transcript_11057/m.28347 type:complete len:231 (-) Transcript_11057:322-1014(-)
MLNSCVQFHHSFSAISAALRRRPALRFSRAAARRAASGCSGVDSTLPAVSRPLGRATTLEVRPPMSRLFTARPPSIDAPAPPAARSASAGSRSCAYASAITSMLDMLQNPSLHISRTSIRDAISDSDGSSTSARLRLDSLDSVEASSGRIVRTPPRLATVAVAAALALRGRPAETPPEDGDSPPRPAEARTGQNAAVGGRRAEGATTTALTPGLPKFLHAIALPLLLLPN